MKKCLTSLFNVCNFNCQNTSEQLLYQKKQPRFECRVSVRPRKILLCSVLAHLERGFFICRRCVMKENSKVLRKVLADRIKMHLVLIDYYLKMIEKIDAKENTEMER
jgi:hypothetical protein